MTGAHNSTDATDGVRVLTPDADGVLPFAKATLITANLRRFGVMPGLHIEAFAL